MSNEIKDFNPWVPLATFPVCGATVGAWAADRPGCLLSGGVWLQMWNMAGEDKP